MHYFGFGDNLFCMCCVLVCNSDFLFWLILCTSQPSLINQAALSLPLLLSFVFNTPGQLINASEFLCGRCIGIFFLLMHIKYFV